MPLGPIFCAEIHLGIIIVDQNLYKLDKQFG